MGELLKPYADDIRLEPFPVYPAAFMGWIYISVSLYLIALAAYFSNPSRRWCFSSSRPRLWLANS